MKGEVSSIQGLLCITEIIIPNHSSLILLALPVVNYGKNLK